MATKTILRMPGVMARTGLSRSSIYKKIAAGEFPPAIRLSPQAVGWADDEIDEWIEKRIRNSRKDDNSGAASAWRAL